MKSLITGFCLKNQNAFAAIALLLLISTFSLNALQARNEINFSSIENECLTNGPDNAPVFEITSDFIATWSVLEVRDYVVLEVMETNDYKLAYDVTEQLRRIIDEPILVKHGYEKDSIVYKIIIGRFKNVKEAEDYHANLR